MLRWALCFLLFGAGAAPASSKLERQLLYPFDPTEISPKAAGEPRLAARRFKTRDGEVLIIWAAKAKTDKPVILYFHGNAGNLATRQPRFTTFLNKGYGLVVMAYRGSSGSSGTPSQNTIEGDAAGLYRALPQIIGAAPIVLYGESLGAAVAIGLTVNSATDGGPKGALAPVAMVLESPFTSIADVGRHLYPKLAPALWLLQDKWPSQDRIGKRNIPLLVLHGADDELVPVAQGRKIHALSAATDKQIFEVPGAGHNQVWQPEAQKMLFEFLSRF